MPRPKRQRCIQIRPDITYFKPRAVPLSYLEEVALDLDELEAIRLKDLKNLHQRECATRMKISVTTFQRILDSAHNKIADALTRGKAISIGKEVNKMPNRDGTGPVGMGPRAGARGINAIGRESGNCICPECDTTVPHKRGKPCYQEKCPKCGNSMIRKS